MKKLFFTIAVCLLTTLSFAKDKKANENVEPVKEAPCAQVNLIVPCSDGFEWSYTGCIHENSLEAMIAQLESGC